jgi:protein-disulfide isomerase
MSRLTIPVGRGDHVAGPPDAPLTLVEYGDYECPHCGHAHPVVQAVQQRFGDRLRFVYRNFPLTEVHPHAEHAAEAAEAAGEAGRFWEMHDLLFDRQDALGDRQLAGYADELGLDGREVLAAIEAGTYTDRIRQDFLGGVRSGVNGTPTFFINGTRYDGSWEYDSLVQALEETLAAARA